VSGRTVRDWFHAGLIPAEVAAGRVFRFDLERVREALAANAEKVRARCGPEYAEVI
jgi:predicted site-specific integrase-resolvase